MIHTQEDANVKPGVKSGISPGSDSSRKRHMKQPRLLIADDHKPVLDELRKLLESEFEIVGTAEDGESLIAGAAALHPDVILLDISMPHVDGFEAARQIKDAQPQIKLIFVTVHADPTMVQEAFRIGASGYVLKRLATSELVAAVRDVLQGKSYVSKFLGEGIGASTDVESHEQSN